MRFRLCINGFVIKPKKNHNKYKSFQRETPHATASQTRSAHGPIFFNAMATDGSYAPMRVSELRWIWEQRGVPPYGRKSELSRRLQEQAEQGEVGPPVMFARDGGKINHM